MMIDYEYYRARRRWHKARRWQTLAGLTVCACLSGLIAWLFITRF